MVNCIININAMKKIEINTHGVLKKTVGLGDAIKKMTTAVGIKPCEACNKRAEKLNSIMSFKGVKKSNVLAVKRPSGLRK